MSTKLRKREEEKAKQQEKLAKKEAFRKFMHHFKPLLITVLLWILITTILHLPGLKDNVQHFFVLFTLESAVGFGKLLFFPIASNTFPNITVSGYTMEVIMECTAYNFYIFVICLSLLSPVKWKQRIVTLLIFLVALFIINNFRFITMGYIGKHSYQWFHYIHDYFWNILFGFLVFLIWVWRYKPNTNETKESSSQEKKV